MSTKTPSQSLWPNRAVAAKFAPTARSSTTSKRWRKLSPDCASNTARKRNCTSATRPAHAVSSWCAVWSNLATTASWWRLPKSPDHPGTRSKRTDETPRSSPGATEPETSTPSTFRKPPTRPSAISAAHAQMPLTTSVGHVSASRPSSFSTAILMKARGTGDRLTCVTCANSSCLIPP